MKYKMVVADLDDSLLGSDLTIGQANCEAIAKAVGKGVLVTIATGRMFRAALPYVNQLNLNVPVITYQGALVKNAISHETLFHCPVPMDDALEIIYESQREDIYLQVYVDDEYYIEKHNEKSDLYWKLSAIRGNAVGQLDRFLREEPTKLLMMDQPQRILQLKERYEKRFHGRLQVTISKPNYLEFTHIDATKGNAVQKLASLSGICRENIIAIGDSYNDLSMISYAGLGVAMGNAPDEVKRHADYITCSNEEAGVAKVIERFVLKGGA